MARQGLCRACTPEIPIPRVFRGSLGLAGGLPLAPTLKGVRAADAPHSRQEGLLGRVGLISSRPCAGARQSTRSN